MRRRIMSSVKVISSVQCRRRWIPEEKREIIEEAELMNLKRRITYLEEDRTILKKMLAIRITEELHAQGICCGKNWVARLMRENGIKACMKKRFNITTKSDHDLPIAEDLGRRDFSAIFLKIRHTD